MRDKPKLRDSYKPDQALQLGRIEKKRVALGVSLEELADRAEIPIATYRRIRKTNRAWLGQVRKLAMALRLIGRDRADDETMFGKD